MKTSVTVSTNWPTVLVILVLAILLIILAFVQEALAQSGHIQIALLLIMVSALVLLLSLVLIQSGTEVAKKALELEIASIDKANTDAKRADEVRKCEEAADKQREHEIQLAKIESVIKVEVSNV